MFQGAFDEALDSVTGGGGGTRRLGPQKPEKEGARVAGEGLPPSGGVGQPISQAVVSYDLSLNGTGSPNAWVQIPSVSCPGCVAMVNSAFLSFPRVQNEDGN